MKICPDSQIFLMMFKRKFSSLSFAFRVPGRFLGKKLANIDLSGLASHHGAYFCQKFTAISRLLPLESWCSEEHFVQFDLILTLL